MSSKQFVEWVHGKQYVRVGHLSKPEEGKGKLVTEVQVFEDTTGPAAPTSKSQQKRKRTQQKKAKDIYTAHGVEGRTVKEASPSEPED